MKRTKHWIYNYFMCILMLFALFGFDLFVEAGSSQIRYKILLIYSFLYVSRFIACIGIDII